MKCPKCGYLGFEEAERCRNCGYDFALTWSRYPAEAPLRDGTSETRETDDLDLIDAAAAERQRSPHAAAPRSEGDGPAVALVTPPDDLGELPLFTDDQPLIAKPSAPRPPLAVRRATPEVPRLRPDPPRTPPLEFQESALEMPLEMPGAPLSPAVRANASEWAETDGKDVDGGEPAGLGLRYVAAGIDLALLAAVDVAVVYFTAQICGLSADELPLLPLGPLLAFLLLQNGGYLVVFTAGGRTVGKMLTGLRVVAAEPGGSLDLGRSLMRTLVWGLMALPAGLGLLTALLSRDRQGLHDRFAGTKVVRASA